MRLLNSKTLQLHEFEQSISTIPRYAILSHTWEDGEITYRDIRSRPAKEFTSKKGYTKIANACRKAQENNLDYVWIDTCCINKSSSAELSESINSMFKWYENAFICYVFLSDLVDSVEFPDCRWWTRGWTLQELIAPKRVVSYDAKWKVIGTKKSLIESISDISGIERKVLLDKREMLSCSVSQKMSWAADRETKLAEDEAYCLLGIFDINMPLLYGEGRKAFHRLQEEIIKRRADLTIFHWHTPRDELDVQYTSLFAESPSAFRLRALEPTALEFPEFSITNKGVFFSNVTDLALIKGPRGDDVKYGFLVGWDRRSVPSAIMLRKVRPGIFCRDGHRPVCGDGRSLERSDMAVLSAKNDFYILTDPGPATEEAIIQSRDCALRLPHDERFQLHCVVPNETWDATDRVFLLTPTRSGFEHHPEWHYPVILAMAFSAKLGPTNIQLVVLYVNQRGFIIFEREQYPEQAEILFAEQNKKKSIQHSDFRKLMPDIASLSSSVPVRLPENWRAHVTVITRPGALHIVSEELRVWDIGFTVMYHREETH
ncbi:heterokaryon incompatibility protein-domain-containing protein [Nemania sp. FL0031]|nr:heterokaryon incompatibility protein-domain-containing protein [Nemania sp. FL0031]